MSEVAHGSNWPRFLASRFQRTEMVLLLAIAAVVLITGLVDTQHNYFRSANALNSARDILRQTSLLGIFALGAAIVIISGGIDLSSGSVIAFSGSMCAAFLLMLAPEEMKAGKLSLTTMALAIAGTLVLGFLIGSLHAWMITVMELPPFVATLATLVGLRSLARAIVDRVTASYATPASEINIYDARFRSLGTNVWIPATVFLVLALVTYLFLTRTVTGRHLYALGGNETAARLSGIHTDRLKWLAYCASSMLASLAGVFYICDQSSATPEKLARGYELHAIAAAVVGGCSLQGGVGSVLGTVLGVVFLRVVADANSKIIKRNADVYEGLLVGGIIVLAVAVNQLRSSLRRGKQFFPGILGITAMLNIVLVSGALAALVGPNIFPVASAAPGAVNDHPLRRMLSSPSKLGIVAAIATLLFLVVVQVLTFRARAAERATGERSRKAESP